MKIKSSLALLLLSLQVACCNASSIEWFDAPLLARIKSDAPYKLPTLSYQNGTSVDTCAGYLENSEHSDLVESPVNFSNRARYLICDARSVYLTGQGSVKLADAKAVHQIANDLCKKLDLSSFPNSFRQTIDSSPEVMSKLFRNKQQMDKNSCVYRDHGRNFVLSAIALESKPQAQSRLLIWLTDEILDGTYRAYQPIWFTKSKLTGMWVKAK